MVVLKSFIGTKRVFGEKQKMEQKEEQQQQQHQHHHHHHQKGRVPQFAGRHPSCMWGVLHVLKYQRWRYIKKRLPHSRPSPPPPPHPTTGCETNASNEIQPPPPLNNDDSAADCSSTANTDKPPSKSIKSSVRSRLKSLISDELLYRKKGNHHHHTFTCPVPQQQQQQQQQQPQSPPHDSKDVSHSSNQISEALDMAFMNKEFMATILQDPHSHFSPQFTSNKRYSKSTSFPSSTALINSSVKEPPQKIQGTGQSKEAEKIAPKELHNPLLLNSMSYARSRSLSTISTEKKMDGISPQLKQSIAPSSPTMGKGNIGRNKSPMKRLKYLKQKIRHVITMEAVLHKIPRGNAGSPTVSDLSNDKKEGGNDILLMSPMKSYADDYCKFVLSSNTENQRLKRTSSLFESLDKYCQLYESTFNRDSKKNIKVEDEPTTRTSLSLEKTHVNDEQIAGANDDQTTTLCSEKSPIIGEPMESCTETKEASSSSTSDDVCGEENKHTSPQNKTPLYEFPVEESNDKLFDDASIFTHEHTASSLPSLSNFKDSEQILRNLIANKLNFLEDHRAESIIDDIIEAEEELDKNNEFQSKLNQTLYCSEVSEYEVDCKDKEKFDYVKGILDISGFSRKELLGAWHSNDQPLDPAVFSEAAGGEHDDNNEHLPMFDLINELLMEIYAKSHTYCPKPLSWLSHIKLMPIGSRVLKEVWGNVKWSLNSAQDHHHLENDHHLLDFLVGRDFEKSDGWMNMQFDCECVGLELEDWIFDDILDELVFEDDPRGSIFY